MVTIRFGLVWFGLVWFGLVWFGLVYLFIHLVTHVTMDTSITVYNVHITAKLIIYGHPPSIIQ